MSDADNSQPAFTEPQAAVKDSIGRGCSYGCLCQVGFFALGFLAIFVSNGKIQDAAFVGWGVTQWIGLVPLILNQRKREHPKTVQGLFIAGALGVLLSSACAAMVFSR